MTVTVWAFETQSPAVVTLPIVYHNGFSFTVDGGVLTVTNQSGQPISAWSAAAYQRAEIT